MSIFFLNSRSRSRGFTIIELIVVIALLGILSAVALPRFMNTQNQAHEANLEGTAAAFQTAALMVRSAWMVEGGNDAIDNINFGDGTLDTNAQGWPVTTTDGLNAMTDSQTCVDIWNALLQNAPSIRVFNSDPQPKFGAGSDTFYDALKHGSRDQCLYFYRRTAVRALSIIYDAQLGTFTVDSEI